MMSKLTQLRDEATRLLTVYHEYQHSEEADLRRKVHLDVDKFLMENRETAMLLIVQGLNQEIEALRRERVAQAMPQPKQSNTTLRKLLRRLTTRRTNHEEKHQDVTQQPTQT